MAETPAQKDFGKLEFLGGLELRSEHKDFGGISGFRFTDAQGRFLAITDKGSWLTGILDRKETAPASLSKTRIGRLRKANGKALKKKKHADAEGLETLGGDFLISFERNHRVERFSWKGKKLQQTSGIRTINLNGYDLENNHGPEAIAYSQETGTLYVFPEGDEINDNLYRGFIIRNEEVSEIAVVRDGYYRITDASFTASGDMFLLERFYNPVLGVSVRIRKFSNQELNASDTIEGEILLEASWRHEIDNMEGLDVSTMADGSTRLTLISDDNFSKSQRTLLLEFRLRP